MKVAFAVTEKGRDACAGDLFTATELGLALSDRFEWEIEFLSKGDDWYALAGINLLIVMVDDYDLRCIHGAEPGLVNVAWARNWFERWCGNACIQDYDLHLVSSQLAANFMSSRVGRRAHVLRIATNLKRFNTDERQASPVWDFVFTGNYWGAERDIVSALISLPDTFRGAIYGKHWELLPHLARLCRGFVAYDELHEVYRQATIVIDDANHVTKNWGAANSRVFDALAAGCLVITNSESVSHDAFDGLLPVYRSSEELLRLLAFYLGNMEERARLLMRLRELVIQRHCYRHRAFELGLLLKGMLPHESSLPSTRGQLTHKVEAVAKAHTNQPLVVHSTTVSRLHAGHGPSISFVVPLFNHLEQTRGMLLSLQASLPPGLDYEIIFADDASTDGTRSWLQTLKEPRIKTVLNDSNKGYAFTNNTGFRLAKGEFLGLLNYDLQFELGWLEPMLVILQSLKLNAGLVGNIQYRVADGKLDHAGIQLNANAQFGHIQTIADGGVPYTKVLAVTGACILLRKADFEAQGGFDERFVNGCEDIDLCFKLSAAGKAIFVATNSRIRHHVSMSRNVNAMQNDRNSRLLFGIWRQKIKRELSTLWGTLLHEGPQAYAGLLSGQLNSDFLATPQTAARVIAEAMLLREEYRWARDLGEADPNADLANRCFVYGLRYIADLNGYAIWKSAEFVVSGLCSARNFYVSGITVSDFSKGSIAIIISVNGIQEQTFKLTDERSFYVGIIDPILLRGLVNNFRVAAQFLDSQGMKIGDASTSIVIHHIVIDDRIVKDFQ